MAGFDAGNIMQAVMAKTKYQNIEQLMLDSVLSALVKTQLQHYNSKRLNSLVCNDMQDIEK